MTNLRKLTDRQEQFVREYMIDLNATRAAVRAGYSRRGAGTRGWSLRRNPAVAARLRAAMDERARVAGITADRVLFEISLLGFANIMDFVETGEDGAAFVDLSRLTREQGAAISAVQVGEGDAAGKVRIKLADKSRNLELMGRHLGLFPRKPARETAKPDAGADAEKDDEAWRNIPMSEEDRYQEVLRILADGNMRAEKAEEAAKAAGADGGG